MTIYNFGGFEHGLGFDLIGDPVGDFYDSLGTAARGSISTTTGVMDGARAMRVEDVGGSFNGFRVSARRPNNTNLALSSAVITFKFYLADIGTNQCNMVEAAGIAVVLKPGDSGVILSGASDSSVITLSETTNYIGELQFAGGSTCTLKIFLNSDGSQVGSTVTATAHGGDVNEVIFGLTNGLYQNDVYFDTWVISSAVLGISSTYKPRCWLLSPDGNGNSTAWTNSYLSVDEIEQDNDTSYISTSSANTKEDVTLTSTTTAGVVGTVVAVKTHAILRNTGGTPSLETYVRIGSTDYENNENVDPGLAFNAIGTVLETSPATTSAWTASELDGTNVGVQNINAVAARCTILGLMVLTDGQAAAGTAVKDLIGGYGYIPHAR